jgi:hypothetical protein
MVPDNTVPQILDEANVDDNGRTTSTTKSQTSTKFPLSHGFQYLALGNGELESKLNDADKGEYLYSANASKTTFEMQGFTTLQNETIRKPFISWAFLNEDGSVVEVTDSNPTGASNILKLTALFDEQDLSSESGGTLENEDSATAYDRHFITEMGLFGGDATDDKDTGHMFNYKLFASWNKVEGSSLLVNWIITF